MEVFNLAFSIGHSQKKSELWSSGIEWAHAQLMENMLAASFSFSLIPPSHHQIPGIDTQYTQSGVDLVCVCDVFFYLVVE